MTTKSYEHCPVCKLESIPEEQSPNDKVSWIKCDICRLWFHSSCVSLTPRQVQEISSYHCANCEETDGPSQSRRHLKRQKVKIDYVALDQGDLFAVDKSEHPHVRQFVQFAPFIDASDGLKAQHIEFIHSKDLTKEYMLSTRAVRPILIPHVSSESGMKLPIDREKLTVAYVAEKAGGETKVEVMDVLSQQSEVPSWNLAKWKDYFYCSPEDRDRIRNVISLEISDIKGLGKNFSRPKMVTDMDLIDKVWDFTESERPKVTTYSLMSVAGSYTDFHIDFSGTPVYYTVCYGSKEFLMFPPTQTNLALYESWCQEPHQNFTWFCDYTKRILGKKVKPLEGFRVSLKAGDLFIIPSGWIHAVYTPCDTVVIGGNYLTLMDLPMHLKIYNIERDTGVPARYRFPMFNKVLWLVSWYYLNNPREFLEDLLPAGELGTKVEVKEESKDSGEDVNENPETESQNHSSIISTVTGSLISHLKAHYQLSLTNPIAKKTIPTGLTGKDIPNYLNTLQVWAEELTN